MPKMRYTRNIGNRLLHKVAFIAPGGWTLRPALHRLRGVTIGSNVWISQYVYIDELHPEAVHIGDNSTVGLRTSIISHLYWGYTKTKDGFAPIYIEPDVFIGPHCLILPGVRIGRGAVIRGGSVISRNVPPRTFLGPPQAGPLAEVGVPLTPGVSYADFLKGLRPMKRRPSHPHLSDPRGDRK